MTQLSAVVIGYGSIGERHARVLRQLVGRVAIVSRRPLNQPNTYSDAATALREERPGYVVVAAETAAHRHCVAELAALGFDGRVLVEKPLFGEPGAPPPHRFRSLHVGFNLRFHPLLKRLKALFQAGPVASIDIYVGQYLPEWRPGRDYRTSSSAAAGGGALRDLSHELDYVTWLFGTWRRMTAIGGKFGDLEIESDDAFGLLLEAERCPLVSIQLNYLDRLGGRRIVVNRGDLTAHADLVAGVLDTGGARETFAVDRDSTYLAMHRAVLAGGDPDLCDAEAGAAIDGMVEAAERAAAAGVWIKR